MSVLFGEVNPYRLASTRGSGERRVPASTYLSLALRWRAKPAEDDKATVGVVEGV